MPTLSTLMIGLALAMPASAGFEHVFVLNAADASNKFDPLLVLIANSDDSRAQLDLLVGLREGLVGRRTVQMPTAWPSLFSKLSSSPDASVRAEAMSIGLVFGDPKAAEALEGLANDSAASKPERVRAVRDLAQARTTGLPRLLKSLLDDKSIRSEAIRALASFDDSEVPKALLQRYPTLRADEKAEVLGLLATRRPWANTLLDALEAGAIARLDVSASHARDLLALKDPAISARVAKLWGVVRPTPEGRKALIETYRTKLGPESLKGADLSKGRAVFKSVCANCHKLFDDGGDIGPELTGSQRSNLDYFLTNVLDPNASVARDYQVKVFAMEDGRILSGIVKAEDDRSVTLRTATDTLVLPKSEVGERKESGESMMPEGLLNNLKEDEVRDLVAYLASPSQVKPLNVPTPERP